MELNRLQVLHCFKHNVCTVFQGAVGGATGYIEIDEDLFTGDVPVDEELFDISDTDIQNLVIDDIEAEEEGARSDAGSVE